MLCDLVYGFMIDLLSLLIFIHHPSISPIHSSRGFFEGYFANSPIPGSDVVESVSCSLDRGSKLAISATVMYALCMCLIPGAVVPKPVGMGGGESYEEEQPIAREEEAE